MTDSLEIFKTLILWPVEGADKGLSSWHLVTNKKVQFSSWSFDFSSCLQQRDPENEY